MFSPPLTAPRIVLIKAAIGPRLRDARGVRGPGQFRKGRRRGRPGGVADRVVQVEPGLRVRRRRGLRALRLAWSPALACSGEHESDEPEASSHQTASYPLDDRATPGSRAAASCDSRVRAAARLRWLDVASVWTCLWPTGV